MVYCQCGDGCVMFCMEGRKLTGLNRQIDHAAWLYLASWTSHLVRLAPSQVALLEFLRLLGQISKENDPVPITCNLHLLCACEQPKNCVGICVRRQDRVRRFWPGCGL